METIGNRIYNLRKNLNLSMEKFGNKLGISKSAISAFEKDISNPSNQTIKLICREFNVDYFWLTEGVGEMFTHFEEVIIDELTEMYDLDKTEKAIVLAYLEADKETRKTIENYILNMADKIKSSDQK